MQNENSSEVAKGPCLVKHQINRAIQPCSIPLYVQSECAAKTLNRQDPEHRTMVLRLLAVFYSVIDDIVLHQPPI